MELVTLFRFVDVLVDAPGGAFLKFFTDLPGNAMAVRANQFIPPTVGRHTFRLALSGACKGILYKLEVDPLFGQAVRIYEAKVYARVLGAAATGWAWYTVPVLPTPVEWQPIPLPILPTGQDWQEVRLPIPQTSDEWQSVQLPVPQTPENWQEVRLPVPQTSPDWQEVRLPIVATPDAWEERVLPVKGTPVVPEWVQVPVDE